MPRQTASFRPTGGKQMPSFMQQPSSFAASHEQSDESDEDTEDDEY